jgi:hypothetical protein
MSYDDLNCKSANIVYGLECNLCRLVYVGETKVNHTTEHAVIDPASLTLHVFISILIALIIRSIQ